MEIPLWAMVVAILLGGIVTAMLSRPTYTGLHRAPGRPRHLNDRGQSPIREWLLGNPHREENQP